MAYIPDIHGQDLVSTLEDKDRIASGKPGGEGAKNIYFENLREQLINEIITPAISKEKQTFSKGTLNISTGEDVFNYDENGNEQLIYTGEGTTLIEILLFIENIGTNSNVATGNFYINGIAILSSDITLATGLLSITAINSPTIAKGDIVEMRMTLNTGDGDVSNGWAKIKAI